MPWEEIDLADPRATQIANDAALTCERLGSPEGELALGQAVIYLALAAKSNAGCNAYTEARAFLKTDRSRKVPVHLRNAPTKRMKQPEWYQPVLRGLEGNIAEKLTFLKGLDAGLRPQPNAPTD